MLLAWSSANRDEQQFEGADEVRLDRWPNRHTAFGMGVHRCAGAHLGRAMARSLIGQVLERMPDYEIDLDRVDTYAHQGVNAGFQRIPATFTPGSRRLPPGAVPPRERLSATTAHARPAPPVPAPEARQSPHRSGTSARTLDDEERGHMAGRMDGQGRIDHRGGSGTGA